MKFEISTDKKRLDIRLIHDFLSNSSYWAKGRDYEVVEKCIENSICFGVYNSNGNLIGFARVLTDYSVLAWVMDLFILEEYRKYGLGKSLMQYIMTFPDFKNVKRIMLATKDAHSLYEKYGFKLTENANMIMECVNSKIV